MTDAFIAFSASIPGIVTSVAPMVCAVRAGPSSHITGLVCNGDTIVTVDRSLPAQDCYFVALSNRLLMSAHPGPRDPALNLAVLRLDTSWSAVNPEIAVTAVGNLVIVVGADADACPTVRLTVIHRFIRTADGPVPVLDLPSERVDQGSLVLALDGRLIGLLALAPHGEAIVIPGALIGRMLLPTIGMPDSLAPPPTDSAPVASPRGWLGVALQPITMPEQLVARTGQPSGRMVVSITKGGPAELAGVKVGDVLLALNGTIASGPQALRAYLDGDRVGTTVAVKLLRDGILVATHLTIAVRPT